MSNKTLGKWLVILAVVLLAGKLVSWYLACGVFVGAGLLLYVLNRQFSLIDEVEAEITWQRNWHAGKAEEYEEDDGSTVGRWTGFWRPALLAVAVVIVVAIVAIGLLLP